MTLGAWVSGCLRVLFIANNISMRDGMLGTHVVLCYRTTSFTAFWWAEYLSGRHKGKVRNVTNLQCMGEGIDGCRTFGYINAYECLQRMEFGIATARCAS